MTEIDPETLKAYRETHYRVLEPPLTLTVGAPSVELARLHEARGVACSAIVTAHNPWSDRADDAENEARQTRLLERLDAGGFAALEALGAHPSGTWSEPSLLVLDLSLEAARALGREFDQNAIVWMGADAIPQLVLLR